MSVKEKISKVKKRDGRLVKFEQQKITDAIHKALTLKDSSGSLFIIFIVKFSKIRDEHFFKQCYFSE
jgi:hypothetical protein